MIIKMSGVTGKQLHKLQTFIDGPENKFFFVENEEKSICIVIGHAEVAEKPSLWENLAKCIFSPVSLIKCDGKTDKTITAKTIEDLGVLTLFDITLEILTDTQNLFRKDLLGSLWKTPKEVIDKVWEALEIFPVN